MTPANQGNVWYKGHSLKAKYNILFDKSPEWISLKPKPGETVYPCYACRHMYSSKQTFQDHINRRVNIIKYRCSNCINTLTFYNRCSFLLHARKHFGPKDGQLNLEDIDIFMLPVELAGMGRHDTIPFLFGEEEEYLSGNVSITSQFYTSDDNDAGKQVVHFRAHLLAFNYVPPGCDKSKSVLLSLKQISSNTPLCEFVLNGPKPNPVPQNTIKRGKIDQNSRNVNTANLNHNRNSSSSSSSNVNLSNINNNSNFSNTSNNISISNNISLSNNIDPSNTGSNTNLSNPSNNTNFSRNSNSSSSSSNNPDPVLSVNGNIEAPMIKQENDAEPFTIPIISKIESLNELCIRCPECDEVQGVALSNHFVGCNKPLNEAWLCTVCKYVSPTKCSYQAHNRMHSNKPPFVCPECGKLFDIVQALHDHMENVCYHLVKEVRFRCHAIKCGKVFVHSNTFSAHFVNHIQSMKQCSSCKEIFPTEADFAEHAVMHDSCTVNKVYQCLLCKDALIPEDRFDDHLNFHVWDRERCVYMYTCKQCRSSFRSTATYAVHKNRCTKNEKTSFHGVVECRLCTQKLFFREKDLFKVCPVCRQITHNPNISKAASKDGKKTSCLLCKEELTAEERRYHSRVCRYVNPIVPVAPQNVASEGESDTSSGGGPLNTSDIEAGINGCNAKKRKSPPQPSSKPKTKKHNHSHNTSKEADNSFDLQADEPRLFDGVYDCKLCGYRNIDRTEFHNHIVNHRSIATAYQCMECGECFVVKPSLLKHLVHYHNISDTTSYFATNDCYDKFAIEELENSHRLVPGQHKGPVNENQCTVCLEQFSNALDLDKHFRVHGMAFLMQKTK